MPSPSPTASPNFNRNSRDYGATEYRDLVREVIEETILPDLLEAADQLTHKGHKTRVTISDSDHFSATSPLAAWARLKIRDPHSNDTAVVSFHGVVLSQGWKVEAWVQIDGQTTIHSCHRLEELRIFTRRQLAFFGKIRPEPSPSVDPLKGHDSGHHLARSIFPSARST